MKKKKSGNASKNKKKMSKVGSSSKNRNWIYLVLVVVIGLLAYGMTMMTAKRQTNDTEQMSSTMMSPEPAVIDLVVAGKTLAKSDDPAANAVTAAYQAAKTVLAKKAASGQTASSDSQEVKAAMKQAAEKAVVDTYVMLNNTPGAADTSTPKTTAAIQAAAKSNLAASPTSIALKAIDKNYLLLADQGQVLVISKTGNQFIQGDMVNNMLGTGSNNIPVFCGADNDPAQVAEGTMYEVNGECKLCIRTTGSGYATGKVVNMADACTSYIKNNPSYISFDRNTRSDSLGKGTKKDISPSMGHCTMYRVKNSDNNNYNNILSPVKLGSDDKPFYVPISDKVVAFNGTNGSIDVVKCTMDSSGRPVLKQITKSKSSGK